MCFSANSSTLEFWFTCKNAARKDVKWLREMFFNVSRRMNGQMWWQIWICDWMKLWWRKKVMGKNWVGRCNRNSPTFSIIPYDINIVAGINGDTLSSSYNYNPSISLLLLRSIMSLEVIVWHWEHDEPLQTYW